jgi:hypothetical protein
MFGLKKKPSQQLSRHVRCLSGVEIFQHENCKPYFSEIRNLVSCPDNIFRELYLTTLYKIAEFCQSMPFSENESANSYEFLTRQLKLATTVLKLRRGELFPKNAQTEVIAAEEAQWTYALFFAALLKDLYCLYTNREVSLYQANGVSTGIWSPLAGSLYEKSAYYNIQFTTKENIITTDAVMAALTRHILPAVVLQWFSNNVILFNQFWNCITHQALHDNVIESSIISAASKAGIPLIKSTILNKKSYKKDFVEYLELVTNDKNAGIIRLESGLFVILDIIEQFALTRKINSTLQFLKSIENDGWLILHENMHYHVITSKKLDDGTELKGILLKIDMLPPIFHELSINRNYQNQVDM